MKTVLHAVRSTNCMENIFAVDVLNLYILDRKKKLLKVNSKDIIISAVKNKNTVGINCLFCNNNLGGSERLFSIDYGLPAI